MSDTKKGTDDPSRNLDTWLAANIHIQTGSLSADLPPGAGELAPCFPANAARAHHSASPPEMEQGLSWEGTRKEAIVWSQAQLRKPVCKVSQDEVHRSLPGPTYDLDTGKQGKQTVPHMHHPKPPAGRAGT